MPNFLELAWTSHTKRCSHWLAVLIVVPLFSPSTRPTLTCLAPNHFSPIPRHHSVLLSLHCGRNFFPSALPHSPVGQTATATCVAPPAYPWHDYQYTRTEESKSHLRGDEDRRRNCLCPPLACPSTRRSAQPIVIPAVFAVVFASTLQTGNGGVKRGVESSGAGEQRHAIGRSGGVSG